MLNSDDNPLKLVKNQKDFSEKTRNKTIEFLNSISFLSNNENIDSSEFAFATKYPIGKTGKKELISLFKQIDGEDNPFDAFGDDKFAKLDSALAVRNLIIHEDRFPGTEKTVKDNIELIKNLVEYIDEYLSNKMMKLKV